MTRLRGGDAATCHELNLLDSVLSLSFAEGACGEICAVRMTKRHSSRRYALFGDRRLTSAILTLVATSLTAPIGAQDGVQVAPSELANIWRVDVSGVDVPVPRLKLDGKPLPSTFLGIVDEFSADGRLVAILPSVSGSNRIEIRNAADGSLVQKVTYPQEAGLAYDVAFSSTGVIALSRLGGVQVYDRNKLDTPAETFDADPRSTPPDCVQPVACRVSIGGSAFSPDGTLLAYQEIRGSGFGLKSEGFLYVVRMSSGARVAKLEAISGRPFHVSFSPDGRWLIAMHYDRNLAHNRGEKERIAFRVWDTSSWAVVREIDGLGEGFEPLATGVIDGAGVVAVYAAGESIEMRDLVRDRVLWSKPLFRPPSLEARSWAPRQSRRTLERVAIAANGQTVVGYEGRGWMIEAMGYMNAIVVRDAHDGSIKAVYDVHSLTDFAVSPDNKMLLYSVGSPQPYTALARLPR